MYRDELGGGSNESNSRGLGEMRSQPSGIPWKLAGTAAALSLVIGTTAAWATPADEISEIGFFLAAIGSFSVLYRLSNSREALGLGLRIAAVGLFLAPIVAYAQVLILGSRGFRVVLGTDVSILIWGPLFILAAIGAQKRGRAIAERVDAAQRAGE